MDNKHIAILALFMLLILFIMFGHSDEYDCNNDKSANVEHVAPVSWTASEWSDTTLDYPDYPLVLPNHAFLVRNHMLPWWNSTRHTRNMSWDIRGDVKPTIVDTGPFYRSPHIGYHDIDYY